MLYIPVYVKKLQDNKIKQIPYILIKLDYMDNKK